MPETLDEVVEHLVSLAVPCLPHGRPVPVVVTFDLLKQVHLILTIISEMGRANDIRFLGTGQIASRTRLLGIANQ